ncbi:hypothetical protein GTW69_40605 [Streptomyces sp. SID7760]|nr:hypothetical protein [Streptomyces sp. SID7760]
MNQARTWTLLTAAVVTAGILMAAAQRTAPRSRLKRPRRSWLEYQGGWVSINVI